MTKESKKKVVKSKKLSKKDLKNKKGGKIYMEDSGDPYNPTFVNTEDYIKSK